MAAIGAEALAHEEDEIETVTVTGRRGGGSAGRGLGTAGTGSVNPATRNPLGDSYLEPDDYAESQPCGDGSTDPNCTCKDGEEQQQMAHLFVCRDAAQCIRDNGIVTSQTLLGRNIKWCEYRGAKPGTCSVTLPSGRTRSLDHVSLSLCVALGREFGGLDWTANE